MKPAVVAFLLQKMSCVVPPGGSKFESTACGLSASQGRRRTHVLAQVLAGGVELHEASASVVLGVPDGLVGGCRRQLVLPHLAGHVIRTAKLIAKTVTVCQNDATTRPIGGQGRSASKQASNPRQARIIDRTRLLHRVSPFLPFLYSQPTTVLALVGSLYTCLVDDSRPVGLLRDILEHLRA